MAGAVDEHDPGAQVAGIAGLGLVEGGGDGVLGRMDDRSGQPLRRRGRRAGGRGWAAAGGWGDDVVRPAGRRVGVEDAGQGGHPLAVRLLAGGEPGAQRPPGGPMCLQGGGPQRFGAHHDVLALDLQDQQSADGRRQRHPLPVVGVDVPGGFGDEAFGLALAQHLPAAAVDRRLCLIVGAADRLGDGEPAQAVGVPARGQGQRGVGEMDAAQALVPPGAPLNGDGAEHAGRSR
ncbi:hypothetical protein [Streptomyces minutiscleroticus]|uniref:hypothetical protein n=1 Tax=Streptomyces minutiscleroticus TaxID=68238 RepID=UPI00167E6CE3